MRTALSWLGSFVFCLALAGPAAAGAVQGVVGEKGAGRSGVMVTARARASGIETTVFSAVDGGFFLDGLTAGGYELVVKIPGYWAPAQALEVDEGRVSRLDFELRVQPEFLPTLPSSQWLGLLPEGEMKREFVLNCGSCHEIAHDRVMREGRPRSSAEWLAAIAMMRALDVYGLTPPDFDDTRYADWLAEHLDEEAIGGLRPGPGASGDALVARITEYPVPKTPSLPHDLVVGPKGRVWVTAFYNNALWALDPATGTTQSYPVNEKPEVMGQVRALTIDRDGMFWALLGGTESVVRLNPANGAIETFAVGMYPHSIELDSTGKLWFNDYISATEQIGSIDPGSGELALYPIPGAALTREQGLPLLYGLQIDRDDVIWGTMLAANKLFRFDTRNGDARLIAMPHTNSGPRRLAVGPDGAIWIPEFNTGILTRFDPKSGAFARHELGQSTLGPYDVAVDQRSGQVWVAAALGSALIRYDPATGRRDRFPLPTEPAYPRHIAIDPRNGDVWTTYSSMPDAEPKIVRLEFGGE